MVDPAAALFEFPEMFTYHVPDARPDSENVTVYVTGENVTVGRVTEDPDTVSVPEYEDGAYILSAVEFSKV